MEEKIAGMLETVLSRLDEHSRILNEHSRILNEHTQILNEHSQLLNEHTQILNKHSRILDEHSAKHDQHTSTLKEHGQMISALRTGQEYLKAEIEGMKISHTKEFDRVNKRFDEGFVQFQLLRDETWQNKSDIQRIKNTMGMS